MGRLHLKILLILMMQAFILLFLYVDQPEQVEPKRIPLDYQSKLNETMKSIAVLEKTAPTSRPSRSQKPLCTESLFRGFFKKHRQLPTNAHLVRSQALQQAYLMVDFCDFNFRNSTVASCLEKSGVRKLTILGDMHARQYAMATMRVFANSSFECDMIRKEKIIYSDGHNKTTVPDKEYYAARSYGLWSTPQLGLRENKQWRSSMHSCYALTKQSSIHSLNIEYLSMVNLTSKIFTLKGWTEATSADTYEEFLFKIYLRDNFPDILVIVLPEDHRRQMLEDQKKQIQNFVNLVKQYVPPSTRVYWLPGTAEVERKKAKKQKKTLPPSEVTFRRNSILYRTIAPQLMPENATHFTFLNLFNVSAPWTTSGQNGLFPLKWYEAVVNSILALPCNGLPPS